MKSCSQPACEHVSDVQNQQEGTGASGSRIPPLKNQDERRRDKSIEGKTGLPVPLKSNPDCATLDFTRANPLTPSWNLKWALLPPFAQSVSQKH